MSKRQYDEVDNREETLVDSLFGQHRLFQVQKIPETRLQELQRDLTKISNVEDYLNVVRYQLETTAQFEYVVRNSDVDADIKQQTSESVDEEEEDEVIEEEETDSVFSQWRSETLDNYKDLKMKYEEMSRQYDSAPLVELPSSIANWKSLVVNSKPQLNILFKLDLSQKFKLISLYQRWCSKKINRNFIQWIFIMILIIPDLLSYNEMSILRSFGKKLGKLIEVVEDEETLICYKWCLIIIAEMYGQKDLNQGKMKKMGQ